MGRFNHLSNTFVQGNASSQSEVWLSLQGMQILAFLIKKT
jgi:hypothetical protein